jgi:hypothetical protein
MDEDDAQKEAHRDEDYSESLEQAWFTPPELLAKLKAEFGFFDLDVLWSVTNPPKPE